jgi:hypothetical protein
MGFPLAHTLKATAMAVMVVSALATLSFQMAVLDERALIAVGTVLFYAR